MGVRSRTRSWRSSRAWRRMTSGGGGGGDALDAQSFGGCMMTMRVARSLVGCGLGMGARG
jgi:hypothetical protein